MRRLLSALRRKWASLNGATGPAVPFRAGCACGQAVQGVRAARHQVVRCPGCGEPVFVLPRSPLPPTGDENDSPLPGTPPAEPARAPWHLPLAAGGLALAFVLGGLFLFFSNLGRRGEPDGNRDGGGPRQTPEELREAGQKLLREGGFHEALRVLNQAQDSGAKDRELIQLHRQAQLLARLLQKSLNEIVQNAQLVPRPEEWQAQFKDYQGRTVLFDDVVRRGPGGEHSLTVSKVLAAEEEARVRLNLTLLTRLPLDQPRRLIFGARLANVSRGQGGVWVIEFEPDSGVLLTDEGAAAALGLPLDADLKDVLRQQAEWARGLP